MTGAPVGSAEGSQAFGENLGVNMPVTGALTDHEQDGR